MPDRGILAERIELDAPALTAAMNECGARRRNVLNDVEIRDGIRIVTATIEGTRYEIPEHWLMGATIHRSFDEALYLWHEQATLSK